MAKTIAKTLIDTPFPSTNRVAKKLNLPKSRVQRVEGMMGLIHKTKVVSSKHSSKKPSKNPTRTSKAFKEFLKEMRAGSLLAKRFVISIDRQSKNPIGTSKEIKEILKEMRAGGLLVERSGVGLEIGPAKTQTDARRIANFFRMAKTKDIHVDVRPLKSTEAQGIKAFVKKAE